MLDATASWMASLIPAPPSGAMVWAASPINSKPGRYQRRKRHTSTVSNEVWIHSQNAHVRSDSHGTRLPREPRTAPSPLGAKASAGPCRHGVTHLPLIATVQ
jgi:hypothetical protein